MSLKPQKIHFIGIGGIGISALARFLKAQGIEVSGSDMAEGAVTKQLKSMGIAVNIPHCKEAPEGADLVIHSAIIKSDNIEILRAKELGIPVLSRKEALCMILGEKQVYAIAGAHGKSTTTAILSAILKEASALIGAESKEFHSNARTLNSPLVVFEADESDKSFLFCNPYCAIVTNAEPEHMETYGHNLEEFHQAYYDFLKLAKKRVINAEDEFLGKLDLEAVRLYPSKEICEISYTLKDNQPQTRFRLIHQGKDYGYFEIYGLGEHIAIDAALAILSVVDFMPKDLIAQNLQNYKGIKKRFDILESEKCVIIDDYAHHPTEIRATLKAIKKYQELINQKEICAIWQPHKYSRILDNLEDFITCFEGVNQLVILPVYSAGEAAIPIDFEGLFSHYNPVFADCIQREKNQIKLLKNNEVLFTIQEGIIVGFNAGNLTYQLRGGIV